MSGRMLLRFHVSSDVARETEIAEWLKAGAIVLGDVIEIATVESFPGDDGPVDVGCCFGIKRHSRRILDGYLATGKRVLMFDKPLVRSLSSAGRSYIRVGIDGPTPAKYLGRVRRPPDRWERLGIYGLPRQRPGKRGQIIFAGSSQKYFTFHGLGDVNAYACQVFRVCRDEVPGHPLTYRPKPSFSGFTEIAGTKLSLPPETISQALAGAHLLITHGSSAAMDAVFGGVPAIALGPCAASPICGDNLENLQDPFFPTDEAIFNFGCNLAYCQWTKQELISGEAWTFLRNELAATAC